MHNRLTLFLTAFVLSLSCGWLFAQPVDDSQLIAGKGGGGHHGGGGGRHGGGGGHHGGGGGHHGGGGRHHSGGHHGGHHGWGGGFYYSSPQFYRGYYMPRYDARPQYYTQPYYYNESDEGYYEVPPEQNIQLAPAPTPLTETPLDNGYQSNQP